MARKYNLDKVSNYLLTETTLSEKLKSIRCSRRTIFSKYSTATKR